ncbi:MAG: trypsin-like peptidase domain-containing protein [Gemmatales bacterium]|nr:trypsin-like peptidase domain-containing protein [Gemmatales bacterium]MDW7993078.1 trypsin-like peptidase domain-containing protein [Gemmatales bacterium]
MARQLMSSILCGMTLIEVCGVVWSGTAARRTAIVKAVERARPAVVSIRSERPVRYTGTEDWGQPLPAPRSNGMGTGIILDPRGYILTNYHVVEEVSAIRVTLADGTQHTAQLVARDRDNDLALLKISPSRPLPTIPLGTSSDLMLGETVIAIGNAFGYEQSITVGVISALGRNVTLNRDLVYKNLIQTDASINPGNSGGPLLNIEGELVGVNVAIRAGAQGIAFALPVDHVLEVASDLFAGLRSPEIHVGLRLRNCVDVSDPHGPVRRWAVVDRVEADSPAARAGLQPGDVILELNGWPILHNLDWQRALLEVRPGDSLPLKWRRGSEEFSANLVVQPTPLESGLTEVVWRVLGLRLVPAPPEQVQRVQASLRGGLTVVAVASNSPSERAGIQPGDILVGLHIWETLSYENIAYVLRHPDRAQFQPLRFFIIRQGAIQRGTLNLPENVLR